VPKVVRFRLLFPAFAFAEKEAEGKEGCQLTAMPAEALAKVG